MAKDVVVASVVALCTALYALRCKEKVYEARRAESCGEVQKLPSATKIQDHPLFTWVLQNGTVMSLVALKFKLVKPLNKDEGALVNALRCYLGAFITVDSALLLNWLIINCLYAHVPFFSEKRKKQTIGDLAKDYLTCNFVVTTLGVFLELKDLYKPRTTTELKAMKPVKSSPLKFLRNLAIMRVTVDAFFWLGHRLMHSPKLYWMHKKHHEHNKTQLTTNIHFQWYDLLIEAFIPVMIGLNVIQAIQGKLPEHEVVLLSSYMFYFEQLSHAGKPLPLMSVLPPLSPFTQIWDDRNPWAHELHHRTLKWNLSISYYFDKLVGTDRWDIKTASHEKTDHCEE